MQDRPTVDELLDAVAGFLHGDVMSNTTGRVNFHARVAGNVLQMLRRELREAEGQLSREWAGLDGLLGPEEAPASRDEMWAATVRRNGVLAGRIREGFGDDDGEREMLMVHFRGTIHDKLVVSNPTLAAER
ncbi:MAG: DUF6285 domain-containing protein [Anaerolineaceae bacterium]